MEEGQSTYRDNNKLKIKVKSYTNKPVPSLCYIISKEGFRDCIIIDPGNSEVSEIEHYVINNNLKPAYIILTHEHFDHIGGVEPLRDLFSCKVISSADCSFNITDPKRNFSLFMDKVGFSCRPAEILFKERFRLKLWNDCEILLIPTPGHSEGSICVSIDNILITGDTLLNNLKMVIKLPGGNKYKLLKSLKTIQNEFNGSTQIYPGHGEPFFLCDVDFREVL